MAPHPDEYEHDNYSTTDDEDEVFNEDMAALVQACMVGAHALDEAAQEIHIEDQSLAAGNTVVASDTIVPVITDSDSDDEWSDLECLKRVQSLCKPSASPLPIMTTTTMITAFDSDNDGDDLEIAHAIFKRFSTCKEGDTASNDKVKTSSDSSESEDSDNMTLTSFLETKSKKRQSKCTKNVSQDSSSSKTKRQRKRSNIHKDK